MEERCQIDEKQLMKQIKERFVIYTSPVSRLAAPPNRETADSFRMRLTVLVRPRASPDSWRAASGGSSAAVGQLYSTFG